MILRRSEHRKERERFTEAKRKRVREKKLSKGRSKGTYDDAFHLEEPFEVKDLETANSCEKDSLYD